MMIADEFSSDDDDDELPDLPDLDLVNLTVPPPSSELHSTQLSVTVAMH